MLFPTIMMVVLVGLMSLIMGSIIKSHLMCKKYPYLCDRFLRTLSYTEQVLKINEKLELHLENDFILTVKVMARNQEGELVKVEKRSFYRRGKDPIQFDNTWHNEIADYLKEMYEAKQQSELKAEKQKQDEINLIKENWN